MAWYFILLIVALFVLLCYFIFSCIIGIKCLKLVTVPPRYMHQESRASEEANGFTQCFADYDSLWERHDFTLKSDDVKLVGEYIVNPNDRDGRKKVAIICHGHTVNRFCAIKYAKMFYELGYNLVIYDARYFGSSSGDCSTLGQNEVKDLWNIITYAKTIFGDDAFIGLHGESMGGATVLLSLSKPCVDFVVADCPFASSKQLFAEQLRIRFHAPMLLAFGFAHLTGILRYHYNFAKVTPINAVAQSEVPICFIHGKADSFILPRHSEEMFRRCRNKDSELHLVDGAEHAQSCVVDAEKYTEILQAFVKKIENAQKLSEAAPLS